MGMCVCVWGGGGGVYVCVLARAPVPKAINASICIQACIWCLSDHENSFGKAARSATPHLT